MKKIIVVLVAILLFGCNSKEKAQYNYDLGITKFNSEEYTQAKNEFSKAIEIYSKYNEAYKERGVSKFMLFDYQGAKEDYSKAIDINSNYIIAYIKRGDVKIFLDDYQGAIEDYSRAIELCKNLNNRSFDLSIAYNKRGVAKSYLSDHIGEKEDYNNAIEAYSNNSDAYSNMASSTVLNGREIKEKDWIIGKDWITGVVDYYHKANNLNPENANVLYNYYILTYLFDSPNKKWQKNAIELNPNYINESENEFNFIDLRTNRSLFGLWSPKYIDNHYALIGSYTKLINNNNNDFESYVLRAKSKKELKDYYGAIADYQKSFEISPLNDSIKWKRADSYEEMLELKTHLQDYDDAILGYSKLLNFQPSESRQSFSYVDRGQVKVFSKDFKGAIDDYTKAIRINPDYSLSYYERGNVKYEIGDYDGAIIDYTQKINLDKSQDEKYSILYMVYWERGNAYAFNDQYKKAIDDYTKSIQIAPYSFSPSYRNRGFAKEKLGNIGGACEDMRIATNLGDETAKKWVADKCK